MDTLWFALAERFGVPVAILVAVGFALWRAARWFAVKIAEPVATRGVQFLDHLEATQQSMSQSIAQIAQSAEEHGRRLDQMAAVQTHLVADIHKVVCGDKDLKPKG